LKWDGFFKSGLDILRHQHGALAAVPQSCGAGAREFRSHRKEKGVTSRTPLFTSIFIHTPEKARQRKIPVGGEGKGGTH